MVHPGWWTHLDGKWFSLWTFKPLWYKVQYIRTGASLAAQLLKNPPPMQKTLVQFLGAEDPLEKGMATHSSMLAWRIAWTKEPGRLQSMGSQRVGQDWVAKHTVYAHIHTHTHLYELTSLTARDSEWEPSLSRQTDVNLNSVTQEIFCYLYAIFLT